MLIANDNGRLLLVNVEEEKVWVHLSKCLFATDLVFSTHTLETLNIRKTWDLGTLLRSPTEIFVATRRDQMASVT